MNEKLKDYATSRFFRALSEKSKDGYNQLLHAMVEQVLTSKGAEVDALKTTLRVNQDVVVEFTRNAVDQMLKSADLADYYANEKGVDLVHAGVTQALLPQEQGKLQILEVMAKKSITKLQTNSSMKTSAYAELTKAVFVLGLSGTYSRYVRDVVRFTHVIETGKPTDLRKMVAFKEVDGKKIYQEIASDVVDTFYGQVLNIVEKVTVKSNGRITGLSENIQHVALFSDSFGVRFAEALMKGMVLKTGSHAGELLFRETVKSEQETGINGEVVYGRIGVVDAASDARQIENIAKDTSNQFILAHVEGMGRGTNIKTWRGLWGKGEAGKVSVTVVDPLNMTTSALEQALGRVLGNRFRTVDKGGAEVGTGFYGIEMSLLSSEMTLEINQGKEYARMTGEALKAKVLEMSNQVEIGTVRASGIEGASVLTAEKLPTNAPKTVLDVVDQYRGDFENNNYPISGIHTIANGNLTTTGSWVGYTLGQMVNLSPGAKSSLSRLAAALEIRENPLSPSEDFLLAERFTDNGWKLEVVLQVLTLLPHLQGQALLDAVGSFHKGGLSSLSGSLDGLNPKMAGYFVQLENVENLKQAGLRSMHRLQEGLSIETAARWNHLRQVMDNSASNEFLRTIAGLELGILMVIADPNMLVYGLTSWSAERRLANLAKGMEKAAMSDLAALRNEQDPAGLDQAVRRAAAFSMLATAEIGASTGRMTLMQSSADTENAINAALNIGMNFGNDFKRFTKALTLTDLAGMSSRGELDARHVYERISQRSVLPKWAMTGLSTAAGLTTMGVIVWFAAIPMVMTGVPAALAALSAGAGLGALGLIISAIPAMPVWASVLYVAASVISTLTKNQMPGANRVPKGLGNFMGNATLIGAVISGYQILTQGAGPYSIMGVLTYAIPKIQERVRKSPRVMTALGLRHRVSGPFETAVKALDEARSDLMAREPEPSKVSAAMMQLMVARRMGENKAALPSEKELAELREKVVLGIKSQETQNAFQGKQGVAAAKA
ncbi:MAG: hypothetical protein HY548_10115, partial [Elusimicrobia bacterium]|nr:hypothetical protein [Elusimicrobiota bacterium]